MIATIATQASPTVLTTLTNGIKAIPQETLVKAVFFPFIDLYEAISTIIRNNRIEIRYAIHAINVFLALVAGLIAPIVSPQLEFWTRTTFPPTASNDLLVIYLNMWMFGSFTSIISRTLRYALLVYNYKETKYILTGVRMRELKQELNDTSKNIRNVFNFILGLVQNNQVTLIPRTELLKHVLDVFMYGSTSEVRRMYALYIPFHDAQLEENNPDCIATSESHLKRVADSLKEKDLDNLKIQIQYCIDRLRQHHSESEDKNPNQLAELTKWMTMYYDLTQGSKIKSGITFIQVQQRERKDRLQLERLRRLNERALKSIQLLMDLTPENSPDNSQDQSQHPRTRNFITSPEALASQELSADEKVLLEEYVKVILHGLVDNPFDSGFIDIESNLVTQEGLRWVNEYVLREKAVIEESLANYSPRLDSRVIQQLNDELNIAINGLSQFVDATPANLNRTLSGDQTPPRESSQNSVMLFSPTPPLTANIASRTSQTSHMSHEERRQVQREYELEAFRKFSRDNNKLKRSATATPRLSTLGTPARQSPLKLSVQLPSHLHRDSPITPQSAPVLGQHPVIPGSKQPAPVIGQQNISDSTQDPNEEQEASISPSTNRLDLV